ncbi:PucR family transcriptional regulator [Kitasatospora sp. NPDC018619]|uniref:PucR family transcriptional regulator n=1 Tax=unclassified Kitasatospora TaxID=2633591 RepID=UPI003793090F
MHELIDRIDALDPRAAEALKVVSYFDTLITGDVGLDGLLRGAAALSGTVAGAERHGRTSRRDPDGRLLDGTTGREPRSPARPCSDGCVWLERDGAAHPNDAVIVERLAFAVELLDLRRHTGSALEIGIDAARTLDDRTTALARLRLDPGTRIRLIATRVDDQAPDAPSTILPTRYGILRASLDTTGRVPFQGRAGLGPWVRADRAPASWDGAVIALRLTAPSTPTVDATDLGAMLMLAQAHDPHAPHEDVRALLRLDARSATVLRALVEADSLRAAAAELGMHHSTLQARHEALTRDLGYDPRSTTGRMRYIAAALLQRLTDPVPGPPCAPGRG